MSSLVEHDASVLGPLRSAAARHGAESSRRGRR
jgi:hypothetical protein